MAQSPLTLNFPGLVPSTSSTGITLPNGVTVNPQALTAAQQAMTPAQLQAQLYPASIVTGAVPTQTFYQWLATINPTFGVSNQTLLLSAVSFTVVVGGILLDKKKR